jgi:NAD-dependent dihydropyrimidine dehydrogenase PreA subunit
MADKPVVDADLCTACAACVDACPEGAMYMNDDESLALVHLDKCTSNGACESVCPTGAITLEDM